MYRVLGTSVASNPVNAEVRDQLNILTSQRNTRVLDAKPPIPGLLWAGLLFGAVVLIGLMGFTRLDNRRDHMILSSAIAILRGLVPSSSSGSTIHSGANWESRRPRSTTPSRSSTGSTREADRSTAAPPTS
jgi:hypothetical protein